VKGDDEVVTIQRPFQKRWIEGGLKKLGIDIIKVLCSSVWLRSDRFRKGGEGDDGASSLRFLILNGVM